MPGEFPGSSKKSLATRSADGRFLLYFSLDPGTNRDLWVLPLEGDRAPWVFLISSRDLAGSIAITVFITPS